MYIYIMIAKFPKNFFFLNDRFFGSQEADAVAPENYTAIIFSANPHLQPLPLKLYGFIRFPIFCLPNGILCVRTTWINP